jgi:hypothetical protein
LNNAAGQPVPNGTYDFTFTLYDTETGGAPLWSEVQTGVPVQGGAFQALLGAGQPIPPAALNGGDRWLEVRVRGPSEAVFTALAPRQRLNATSTAPDSASAAPSCPHDHWGESWDGSDIGLVVRSSDRVGVFSSGAIEGLQGYSLTGNGVQGWTDTASWGGSGVWGEASKDRTYGVYGKNTVATGVYGRSDSGYGVYGQSDSYYAGYFLGLVHVNGHLSKSSGSFKIDHPLDLANKYLNHSFVESPDMKNIYDGVAVLDANGEAWVELPAWFEALNKDFRYQLTPIGAPGPNLYIAQEIQNNRFQIAGGTPGMKVSWQVTGIRHDPWAVAHPIPVEEDKPAEERGTYLRPVEHGQPETSGLDYQRYGDREGPGAGGEP